MGEKEKEEIYRNGYRDGVLAARSILDELAGQVDSFEGHPPGVAEVSTIGVTEEGEDEPEPPRAA